MGVCCFVFDSGRLFQARCVCVGGMLGCEGVWGAILCLTVEVCVSGKVCVCVCVCVCGGGGGGKGEGYSLVFDSGVVGVSGQVCVCVCGGGGMLGCLTVELCVSGQVCVCVSVCVCVCVGGGGGCLVFDSGAVCSRPGVCVCGGGGGGLSGV